MAVTLPEVSGSFGDNPALEFPESEAPGGLHVSVLEEGTGPTVQSGREIEVNYHGQIWGGGIFDSSFLRGAPAAFCASQAAFSASTVPLITSWPGQL